MLKKIFFALLIIVVALGVVIAMQPGEYRVSRTMKMSAPASVVFDQVNDFHKWQAWSPWSKIDPKAKETFEGPMSGAGAIIRWAGNSEVGEGSMTITESKPHELVRIKLEFLKPMAGAADTEFVLKPAGDQTDVTWSMSGKNNFLGKAMCLLFNMETMIGSKYEEGLASIKSIVEAPKKD